MALAPIAALVALSATLGSSPAWPGPKGLPTELESWLAPVLVAAPRSQPVPSATPASPSTAAQKPPPVPSCPVDMKLVEGVHYEQVQRLCTDFRRTRCFGFLPGLVMKEPRVTPVRVCMDAYEWPNERGLEPVVMVRFVDAEAMCASRGKRLCTEFEWELACEGPLSLPWPYGFAQRPGACNNDKPFKPYSETKLNSPNPAVRQREMRRVWQGAPSGSFPVCRSPFGVMDLVGNVEEWVATSRPQWPYRSALKGGYWAKPWSGCRGTNERHAPMFRYYEIGFRCCRDVGKGTKGLGVRG